MPYCNCADCNYVDPPEVTEEHLAKAVDEYAAKKPRDVVNFLDESAWFADHVREIVAKCPKFRKELMASGDVQIAAQQIANNEAAAAREQSLQDEADAAFEDEICHPMFSPEEIS
jgi:hypothetical protein